MTIHAGRLRRDAIIAELGSLGCSQTKVAKLIGRHSSYVSMACKRAGIRLPRESGGWEPHKAKSRGRAEQMAALYRAGYTLQQIGDQHGITRERVRQLMTKHLGVRRADGGVHAHAVAKQDAVERDLSDRIMRRAGCTVDQWRDLLAIGRAMIAAGKGIATTPLAAYRCQRHSAKNRGIGWELTAWQWWMIWQQSGHWLERGRGQGYVMCRKGDIGPYAVGNVFIATSAENSSEFQRSRRKDPSLPTGVTRTSNGLSYVAMRCRKHLGTYSTVGEAHAAYLLNRPLHDDKPAERIAA